MVTFWNLDLSWCDFLFWLFFLSLWRDTDGAQWFFRVLELDSLKFSNNFVLLLSKSASRSSLLRFQAFLDLVLFIFKLHDIVFGHNQLLFLPFFIFKFIPIILWKHLFFVFMLIQIFFCHILSSDMDFFVVEAQILFQFVAWLVTVSYILEYFLVCPHVSSVWHKCHVCGLYRMLLQRRCGYRRSHFGVEIEEIRLGSLHFVSNVIRFSYDLFRNRRYQNQRPRLTINCIYQLPDSHCIWIHFWSIRLYAYRLLVTHFDRFLFGTGTLGRGISQ